MRENFFVLSENSKELSTCLMRHRKSYKLRHLVPKYVHLRLKSLSSPKKQALFQGVVVEDVISGEDPTSCSVEVMVLNQERSVVASSENNSVELEVRISSIFILTSIGSSARSSLIRSARYCLYFELLWETDTCLMNHGRRRREERVVQLME